MITAIEALRLDSAKLTKDEINEFLGVLEIIEGHIREKMTFAGPPPLDVPVRLISGQNVVKAVIIKMLRDKWNIGANLMSELPRFQGGAPIPHHWTFQIAPKEDAYNETDLEFNPQLKLT